MTHADHGPNPVLDPIADRIRFLSRAVLLLFLTGWVGWFYPYDDLLDRRGTPLGADFSMFYVSGLVLAEQPLDRLYDQSCHQTRLRELFPQLDASFCLPFRYPPWIAALAWPLAQFPYPAAFGIFFALSGAAWLLTVYLLHRHCGGLRPSCLVWALVGWPIAWETLIGGQASAFAALIAVAALALAQSNRPIAAGAVLALAAYKPNVLAWFGLGLLIRYPRMLLGLIPAAMLLVGALYACGVEESLDEYILLLSRLTRDPWDVETPFWKVHGLVPWLASWWPQQARSLAIGFGFAASAAVGMSWRRWGKDPSIDRAAPAALLIVNALFNPYTPIYDLILLGPAAVLFVSAWRTYRTNPAGGGTWPPSLVTSVGPTPSPAAAVLGQLAFACLFFGPHLSQALAPRLGVQLFPLVLLALLGAVVASASYGVNRTLVWGSGGALSR